MSKEAILYDVLSCAIKFNEFSVFDTNYSCRLPKPQLIELFHQACCWDRCQMLEIMLERGFNTKDAIEITTQVSHTEEYTHKVPILFETLSYGSVRALDFLLSHGVDPNVFHPDTGHTALYYAGVRLGLGNRKDFQYIKTLLKYNPDLTLKNKNDGKTVLDFFTKDQLIELGAKI